MFTLFFGPVGDRLGGSPRLQRILARVHAAGVRPVGELLIELLEAANSDPAVLDRLEDWARLDPETVRRLGSHRFLAPPLHLVPRQERER
jgi:hypothetical protein